jgi:hypothetical protein
VSSHEVEALLASTRCPVPANRPLRHKILLVLLVLPLRFARILIVRAGLGYVDEAAAEWAERPAWLGELDFVDTVGADRRVGCRHAAQILNRSQPLREIKQVPLAKCFGSGPPAALTKTSSPLKIPHPRSKRRLQGRFADTGQLRRCTRSV